MANSVEFKLDLDQNVENEGKQAARGLERFENAAEDAGKAAEKSGAQMGKTEGNLGKLKSAFSSMKAPVVALVAAFAAVGAAAGAVAVKFGEAVFEGADFARTTRGMFTSFTGSAAGGEQALEDIAQAARRTSAPLEEVRKTYGTLAATGIKGQLLNDLVAMRFDFAAMGEEAESAFGKFTDAMVEGEVTASQFEDIAKNLGGKDVFGKALGLSDLALQDTQAGVAQLGAELKAMDPRRMLEVAAATHEAQRGLGKTAKAAASFDQRMASIKEMGQLEIGMRIQSSIGPVLDKVEAFMASKQGQQLFDDIASAIDTAIPIVQAFGEGLFMALDHAATAMGPALKGFSAMLGASDADTWQTIAKAIGYVVGALGSLAAILVTVPFQLFASMAAVATGALSAFTAFLGAVEKGARKAGLWVKFMGAMILDELSSIGEGFSTSPSAWLVSMGAAIMSGAEAVWGAIRGLADGMFQNLVRGVQVLADPTPFMGALQSSLGVLPAQALAWGINLIGGFVSGILSGIGAVRSAAQAVASAATTSIQGALGIHSDSKVFAQMGGFMTGGAATGIEGGIPEIQRATQNAFDPGVMTAKAPAMQPAAGGGSDMSVPPMPAPGPEMFTQGGGVSDAGIAPAGGAAGAVTFNATFNLSQQQGEDSENFAQRCRREFQTWVEAQALAFGV